MKSSKITAAVLAGIAGVAVLTLSACSSDPEPATTAAPVSSAPATDVPATDVPVTETPATPASPSDMPATETPATTEGSTTPSDSASPSDDMLNPVATPIMVELDAITDPAAVTAPIDATVGQAVVFNSMTPEGWVVAATPEGVVELHQGGKDGDAMMNPGVLGLAAGTATVTVTSATDPAKVYTFVVNVK